MRYHIQTLTFISNYFKSLIESLKEITGQGRGETLPTMTEESRMSAFKVAESAFDALQEFVRFIPSQYDLFYSVSDSL